MSNISAPQGERRVIKKLRPQAPGARRWAAEYGEKLACVRFRVHPLRQRRLTTLEIIVAEAPTLDRIRASSLVVT